MIVLIKLLLAHLLGDFVLQPDSWVKAKEDKKFKSLYLYFHCLIHGVLVMLLIWDWNFWKWALIVTVVHFLVDVLKILIQNKNTKRFFFFADQIAHLLLIYIVWTSYQGTGFSLEFLTNEHTIALITAILLLTQPASVVIKTFISKWTPKATGNDSLEKANTYNPGSEGGAGGGENEDKDSLQKAGTYIGILERLFVFVFVISNQWEAIGFLMAAKSVFRFGDLKAAHERKLTEYILIGTFVSFGIAILIGVLYLQIIK